MYCKIGETINSYQPLIVAEKILVTFLLVGFKFNCPNEELN